MTFVGIFVYLPINLHKLMENTTIQAENNKETLHSKICLSTRAKNLLLPHKQIKQKIADAIGKDYWTVHRWIQHDDSKITQAAALQVIREETGLTNELILQEIAA